MIKVQIKNKNAFSLVEVLIILMFIGIALMMAINIIKLPKKNQPSLKELWKNDFAAIVKSYPSVNNSSGNNVLQSDHKVYVKDENNLSNGEIIEIVNKFVQAYSNGEKPKINDLVSTESKNGNEASNSQPTNTAKDNELTSFDISKYCGSSQYICGVSPQVSVKKSYKTLANGYLHEEDLSQNQFMLANGGNVYTGIGAGGIIDIWVDVNGYKKGPNTLGRDLFGVVVVGNKVIPMGNINSSANPYGEAVCGRSDAYVPLGSAGKPLDYAGASCSMTVLLEE